MKNKILLIIITAAVILLILWSFDFNIAGNVIATKDKFSSVEDKCKPAAGYTEESWKEHMSHHPDIYKECLSADSTTR